MKQLIIVLSLIFVCFAVKAQPESGSFLLGGHVGFSVYTENTESSTDYKSTGYSFMPLIGFFIGNRSALGAQLGVSGYSITHPDSEYDNAVSQLKFNFSPFYRFYIVNKTGGLFLEASIPVGVGTNKITNESADLESTDVLISVAAGIAPGVYYFVTPKIMIEATIGWFGYSTDMNIDEDDNVTNTNQYGFNINPASISFGVVFAL